jgi:hypothetical protein
MRRVLNGYLRCLLCWAVVVSTLACHRGEEHQPTKTRSATVEPSIDDRVIRGLVCDARAIGIRRARIEFSRDGDSTPHWVFSDDFGHFLTGGLPPGNYRVRATHSGFVRTSWGQAGPHDVEAVVDLTSVREAALKIILRPAAELAGVVRDESGGVVSGASILVYERIWSDGQMRWQVVDRSADAVKTDNSGKYFLSGIAPGDYLVAASISGAFMRRVGDNPLGYPPTFHPSAPDAEHAQVVRLSPDRVGVADVHLRAVAIHRLNGRVEWPAQEPFPGGYVRLLATGSIAPSGKVVPLSPVGEFSIETLGFEGPGQLSAIVGPRPLADVPRDPYVGSLDLTVPSADVDGLNIALAKGRRVQGRVVGDLSRLRSLRVFARPFDRNVWPSQLSAPIAADGSFVLTGVHARSEISTDLPPSTGLRVLSSLLSGVDVDSILVAPQGQDLQRVELRIGPSAAALSGRAESTEGFDSLVALVLDARPGQVFRRVVAVRTDATGRFSVTQLIRGHYYVAVVPAVDLLRLESPPSLQWLRRVGRAVDFDGNPTYVDGLPLSQWPFAEVR